MAASSLELAATTQMPGVSQNNFFEAVNGTAQVNEQTATHLYPPGQNFSEFPQQHDFYDDSETDKVDKSGLSKRERQMIKAYGPSNNISGATANGPFEDP